MQRVEESPSLWAGALRPFGVVYERRLGAQEAWHQVPDIQEQRLLVPLLRFV